MGGDVKKQLMYKGEIVDGYSILSSGLIVRERASGNSPANWALSFFKKEKEQNAPIYATTKFSNYARRNINIEVAYRENFGIPLSGKLGVSEKAQMAFALRKMAKAHNDMVKEGIGTVDVSNVATVTNHEIKFCGLPFEHAMISPMG